MDHDGAKKAPFVPTLTSINRLCFVIANKKNKVLHAFVRLLLLFI